MFHLAPVRLWRNISIVMAVAAGIAALAGTFFADGSIAVHWSGSGEPNDSAGKWVHWSGSGEPNDSAGKWVLWVMLLLAVLSLFTYSSFLKRRPGFQTPIGREMACAMSAGLVSMFSLIDITLVVYDFYSFAMVPIIGTAAIVSVFIIYALIAYFRERHGPEAREKK